MASNQVTTGIFIRGMLIGVGKFSNRGKGGETFEYMALGINIPFVNSFGFSANMTKEIRISQDKQKDSAFMKSLADNYNAIVELEIGVGDYRNIFVDKDAILTVLEPAQHYQSA